MTTLSELVEDLRKLKLDIVKAEMALFQRCRDVEIGQRALWTQADGCATFDRFLEKYEICDSSRYRQFVEAVQHPEIVQSLGVMNVDVAIQAAAIQQPDRRAKYIQAASERFAEKHTPWQQQEARSQRLQIGGSAPKDSRWNKVADDRARLHAENVELKKRLRELEAKLKDLQEENDKLKARIGGGQRKPKAS